MLVVSTLIALAQVASPPAAAPRAPREQPAPASSCAAIVVSSPEAKTSARAQSLSATKILDLQLAALLRTRLQGEHTLDMRVYTPKGHLYQVLTVPFSAAAAGPVGTRQVEGYPEPLPEQAMTAVRHEGARRYSVSTRLPVAGTTIMTSSLYGRWRVDAHLDGDLEACASKAFILQP